MNSVSPAVLVLTTSEGRDKLFKMIQCTLKLVAWTLLHPRLLPESALTEYWVNRLLGNVHTIRNGRALFKTGRWIVTIIDLIDLAPQQRQATGERKWILTVLILRSILAIVRNFLRDVANIYEKNLFGIHLRPEVKVPLDTTHRYVASINWLLIAAIDLGLLIHRMARREWFPSGRCLTCGCDGSSVGRLEFPEVDFAKGCPAPRNAEFTEAVLPKDMSVRCRYCDAVGVIGAANTWPSRDLQSESLAFPRALSTLLTSIQVVEAHPNLREHLLLIFKGTCELVQACCCALMVGPELEEIRLRRSFISNVCGLVSSFIAVRRVWLSASA